MKLMLVSIRDEITQEYERPGVCKNVEEVKRSFADLCKFDEKMKLHTEDYSIWHMGDFDTETGTITTTPIMPILIERGAKLYGNEN